MAVYQCQCDLILSTPEQDVHCPRCGQALADSHRLFVGNEAVVESPSQAPTPAPESGGPSATTGFVAHNLYGFVFAIAHIRTIGQAWLGQ